MGVVMGDSEQIPFEGHRLNHRLLRPRQDLEPDGDTTGSRGAKKGSHSLPPPPIMNYSGWGSGLGPGTGVPEWGPQGWQSGWVLRKVAGCGTACAKAQRWEA